MRKPQEDLCDASSAKARGPVLVNRGSPPDFAIAFIDSHTEGEPTRVVYAPFAVDPQTSAAGLRDAMRDAHDWLRRFVIDPPRGHAALVGAMLVPPPSGRPASPTSANTIDIGRVVFFNNVGYLPMCVHATIGLARTLVHLGHIEAPDKSASGEDMRYAISTPAGQVAFGVGPDGLARVENVPAYRLHRNVRIETSRGPIAGDVAWGGNWFYIVRECPVPIETNAIEALTSLCLELRHGLATAGIQTDDGRPIDHIQLCGPASRPDSNARNFVLCPGGEYDRSACGTGTSARLACLADDGEWGPGELWRQESITGSTFEAHYRRVGTRVIPTICGRAFITAHGHLVATQLDTTHEVPREAQGARRG